MIIEAAAEATHDSTRHGTIDQHGLFVYITIIENVESHVTHLTPRYLVRFAWAGPGCGRTRTSNPLEPESYVGAACTCASVL